MRVVSSYPMQQPGYHASMVVRFEFINAGGLQGAADAVKVVVG